MRLNRATNTETERLDPKQANTEWFCRWVFDTAAGRTVDLPGHGGSVELIRRVVEMPAIAIIMGITAVVLSRGKSVFDRNSRDLPAIFFRRFT